MAEIKIETALNLVFGDIEKARKAKAWMLAFSGALTAIDILAMTYQMNKVFRQRFDIKSLDQETTISIFEEWQRGKSGQAYKGFLKYEGLNGQEAEKIYALRCSLVHGFATKDIVLEDDDFDRTGALWAHASKVQFEDNKLVGSLLLKNPGGREHLFLQDLIEVAGNGRTLMKFDEALDDKWINTVHMLAISDI